MSDNQPGRYDNGQTQQPAPYGEQGDQPCSCAPPSYGQHQAPFGRVPPASQGGGKKTTGIIVGAVVAFAVIAGGVYYFTVSDGGESVANDGPHKLTTPSDLLGGEYEEDSSSASSSAGGFTPSEIKEAQQEGVKNPRTVGVSYATGDRTETTGKTIRLGGLYGEIDDPEKVVDAMFAWMKADDAKSEEGIELVGAPRDFSTKDAILKCQEIKFRNGFYDGKPENGAETMRMAVCVWGDHSTLARVIPMNIPEALAGGLDLKGASDVAAKVREDVRVKK